MIPVVAGSSPVDRPTSFRSSCTPCEPCFFTVTSVDGAGRCAAALCHGHINVAEASRTTLHQNSPPDCFAATETVDRPNFGSYNRPIKVAYLIPSSEDATENLKILPPKDVMGRVVQLFQV